MGAKQKKQFQCDCPRCRGVKTADRQWGFDRAKVRSVECMHCGRKIGRRPYRLVKVYARFGSMMFQHEQCPKGKKA